MKRFLLLWLLALLYAFTRTPPHALPLEFPLRIEQKNRLWLYAGTDAEHNRRLRQRFRHGCDAHYPRSALQSLPPTELFYFSSGGKRFSIHVFNEVSQRYPVATAETVYFCRAELINAFYLLMDAPWEALPSSH